jgi:hypothetical protein
MAEAVNTVDAREGRLSLEAVQLILVGHLSWDQAAFASKGLGLVQKVSLRLIADRSVAFLAAFGLGGLERQHVALVGPAWLDLDAFLTAQAEGFLKPQGHGRVRVGHPVQLALIQLLRLGLVRYAAPVGDAIGRIVAGHDVFLADPLATQRMADMRFFIVPLLAPSACQRLTR